MKQRILLKGPFLSLSGYGYQARFALNALKTREDLFDIYLINVGWGQTSWVTEHNKERTYIEEKILKTIHYVQSGGKFDINLQITIPNEVEQAAPINILYTAGIETTRVAPGWLEKINLVDKVIVVSNHSKNVFESTSYDIENQVGQKVGELRAETPITAVNYPVRDFESENISLDLDYDFNFLTMAQWGPRKDLGKTIVSFLEEFWEDEVGLVVKTFIRNNALIDRRKTEERLDTILEEVSKKFGTERKCKIYLLHGALSNGKLRSLYTHKNIRVFTTTTHGEGFGLSIFESAYNGLPVIAPGWSGQCDFLYKEKEPLFTDIEYTLKRVGDEAVWDGVIQKDSMWAYANPESLKKKMREVYEDCEPASEKALALKNYLLEEFTPEKKYEEFVEAVFEVIPDSNISDDDIDNWLDDMDIDLIEAD